jgi:hypothetical protein
MRKKDKETGVKTDGWTDRDRLKRIERRKQKET